MHVVLHRCCAQIFHKPALLRTVMDNPLVQQITASPGMVHQLIAANPQMRELMEVSFFFTSFSFVGVL